MTKWTVALFGHHKLRFELREKKLSKYKPIVAHSYHGEPYYYLASSFSEKGRGYSGSGYHEMTMDINLAAELEVNRVVGRYVEEPTGFDEERYFVYNIIGWEKRAEPGDIIAVKPFGEGWTPDEREQFLIVIMDGLIRKDIEALAEPYFDTNDYKIPTDEDLANLLEGEVVELYPRSHLKKRRFNIPLNDLKQMGVNLDRMLDKKDIYVPEIKIIRRTKCFDKMRERKVLKSDGLNHIRPLIYKRIKGVR